MDCVWTASSGHIWTCLRPRNHVNDTRGVATGHHRPDMAWPRARGQAFGSRTQIEKLLMPLLFLISFSVIQSHLGPYTSHPPRKVYDPVGLLTHSSTMIRTCSLHAGKLLSRDLHCTVSTKKLDMRTTLRPLTSTVVSCMSRPINLPTISSQNSMPSGAFVSITTVTHERSNGCLRAMVRGQWRWLAVPQSPSVGATIGKGGSQS